MRFNIVHFCSLNRCTLLVLFWFSSYLFLNFVDPFHTVICINIYVWRIYYLVNLKVTAFIYVNPSLLMKYLSQLKYYNQYKYIFDFSTQICKIQDEQINKKGRTHPTHTPLDNAQMASQGATIILTKLCTSNRHCSTARLAFISEYKFEAFSLEGGAGRGNITFGYIMLWIKYHKKKKNRRER